MATLDQVIKFESNKAYPSLPSVGGDPESHSAILTLMKQALEIHERRTPDYLNSFVRVQELVDLGLITVDGNQLNASVGGADASGVHNDLSGRTDSDAHSIGAITGLSATLNSKLNVSASNGPLTGDLGTQTLTPSTDNTYHLGSEAERYRQLWNGVQRTYLTTGLGTFNLTHASNTNLVASNFLASVASATVNVNFSPALGSSPTIFGSTLWAAAANQTATVNMTGTGGYFFGSIIMLLNANPITATVTVGGRGNSCFGAIVPDATAASDMTISMLGDGSWNFGSINAAGGNITLDASTVTSFNLGSVDNGTILLQAAQVLNLGSAEQGATITVSGTGSVNLVPAIAGDITLSGAFAVNAGSTQLLSGTTGSISLTASSTRNFGSLDTTGAAAGATASIAMGGSANTNFMLVAPTAATDTPSIVMGAGGLAHRAGFAAGIIINGSLSFVDGASAGGGFFAGQIDTSGSVTVGNAGFIHGFIVGAGNVTQSNNANIANVYMPAGAASLVQSGQASFYNGFLAGTFNLSGFGTIAAGYFQPTVVGATVSGSGSVCLGVFRDLFGGALSITGESNFVLNHSNITPAFDNTSVTVTGDGNFLLYDSSSPGFLVNTYTISGRGTITAVASDEGTFLNSGIGSQIFGYSDGATMTSSSTGSFVGGAAVTNAITASASGALAFGDSTAAAITATASNAVQLGPGGNAQANSLQVGTAGTGLAFKGTAGAFAVQNNGQFWQSGGNVFVRVNAKNLQFDIAQTYTTGTYATRRSFAGLTPTITEVLEILETLVEDMKTAGYLN